MYKQFYCACEYGDYNKIREILPYIIDINKSNDKGWNAIIIAAFNHHLDILRFLIQNGADINSTNINGTSVFMYAKTKVLQNDNYEILDFLIENGADINTRDKKNNWTVLDYARSGNHAALIKYLLTKGAI